MAEANTLAAARITRFAPSQSSGFCSSRSSSAGRRVPRLGPVPDAIAVDRQHRHLGARGEGDDEQQQQQAGSAAGACGQSFKAVFEGGTFLAAAGPAATCGGPRTARTPSIGAWAARRGKRAGAPIMRPHPYPRTAHVRQPDSAPDPHRGHPARPRPHHRGQRRPKRCARSRVALLEADVALPVIKSFIDGQGQGAGRRGRLEPHARAGLHRHPPRGARRADGRRAVRASTCVPSPRSWCCWPACRAPARPPPQRSSPAGSSSGSASACCWSAPTCAVRPPCCSCERLARQVGAEFFPAPGTPGAARYRARGARRARRGVFDVLIVDTAGRLHVDEA